VDLALYLRVLWRWRVIVLAGLTVGLLLAVTSMARIDFDGAVPRFTPRTDEVWLSASTIFVTQDGFPWGRTIFDETIEVEGSDGEPTFIPRFADPGRLSGLAVLYTELAKSDEVRRAFLMSAPPGVTYEPVVVKSTDGSSTLPMIYMKGYGPTAALAEFAANHATTAFRRYLGSKQAEARISRDKRVETVVTSRATPAELFEPRSIVRPIFLLLLVLMASIGLAFVLENLWPRPRTASPHVPTVGRKVSEPTAAPSSQRTA
jgi:hypothetical protein